MIQIAPLIEEDIPAAMRLVEAAGWNQTPADWQRVIDYQPWGCFKATENDRLVGTVTSTAYGQQLAWIGMMLVDPSMRRQGIGRMLMQSVIAALESAAIETIKLDATPMGRPLYEQLGFVAQFDFQRLRRPETAEKQDSNSSAFHATLSEIRSIHGALDQRAFGVDRWSWLTRIAADSVCLLEEAGFGMMRRGRIADYLGPVSVGTTRAARQLIAQLAGTTSAAIFWDLPQRDHSILAWARELGFEPVRDLTRMTLRHDTTAPDVALQMALCDPACG